MLRKIKTAYHRNGIAGEGFDVALFEYEGCKMVAILFDDPGQCAVLNVALLVLGDIAFGSNSWRGDHFERELRTAIARARGK